MNPERIAEIEKQAGYVGYGGMPVSENEQAIRDLLAAYRELRAENECQHLDWDIARERLDGMTMDRNKLRAENERLQNIIMETVL